MNQSEIKDRVDNNILTIIEKLSDDISKECEENVIKESTIEKINTLSKLLEARSTFKGFCKHTPMKYPIKPVFR